MARKSERAKLILTQEEKAKLQKIAQSRTAEFREVQRANILIQYEEGKQIMKISKNMKINRGTVYKCIDKALAGGIKFALKDKPHGSDPIITPAAKAWVINLACTKPKDYGRPEELWTYSLLVRHVRKHAPEKGHECLKKAHKSTIWRILNESDIQPHKIRYYIERRDPEFEEKMNVVLMVYYHVKLQNKYGNGNNRIITLSLDEKPGIQALKNVGPDLPPMPGEHQTNSRDSHYKRLGTLSILAALDLHDGRLFAQVHERHRSEEFISLLKDLDAYYPDDRKIRLILDNHSIHTSKETMDYLSTRPNRFILVFTPKHGSWLNIIETLFSKMARSLLKEVRVESKEELKDRILKWVENLNEEPVIHRWTKFNIRIKG